MGTVGGVVSGVVNSPDSFALGACVSYLCVCRYLPALFETQLTNR